MDDVPGQIPLFSSPLVNTQTNPDQQKRETAAERAARKAGDELYKRLRHFEYVVPPITSQESHWRHADWQDVRTIVRDALLRTGMSENRRSRFDNCGSDAVVEYNKKEGRHRVRANHCGDRFCVPCARARAAIVRANLLKWMEQDAVRFITLTLKPDGQSFTDLLNHLYASFVRLRASQTWRRAVTAGAFVTEYKLGRDGKSWNIHLHVLAVGSYFDKKELSEAWRVASGGSFIIDIRKVGDNAKAAGYLTQYFTKGFDPSVLASNDHLDECVVGLRGRRLLGTFGQWHGRRLERPSANREDWQRVDTLEKILHACWRGEEWARGVVRSLQGDNVEATNFDRSTVAENSGPASDTA